MDVKLDLEILTKIPLPAGGDNSKHFEGKEKQGMTSLILKIHDVFPRLNLSAASN
jgi:hypothetical protein